MKDGGQIIIILSPAANHMKKIFLLYFLLFTGCSYQDNRELFHAHKDLFERVENLRDTLYRRVPGCYIFSMTRTPELFYTNCDSSAVNARIPYPFYCLTKEERAFYGAFMKDCKLGYIQIGPKNTRFIFQGYETDMIIRTSKSYPSFEKYKLDSLYYIIPAFEISPE